MTVAPAMVCVREQFCPVVVGDRGRHGASGSRQVRSDERWNFACYMTLGAAPLSRKGEGFREFGEEVRKPCQDAPGKAKFKR